MAAAKSHMCICADCTKSERKKNQKPLEPLSPMARKALAKAFAPGRKRAKSAAAVADRRALRPRPAAIR